jgi:hypothetical protein
VSDAATDRAADRAVLATSVWRDFAGRRRKFELRIGEIGELERLCEAGIGAIFTRVSTMQFRLADIRETIRLGLEGAGLLESEATALVLRYLDGRPLLEHIQIAADILIACCTGIEEDLPGKAPAETPDAPATSAPSTNSGAPPDSPPATSTA